MLPKQLQRLRIILLIAGCSFTLFAHADNYEPIEHLNAITKDFILKNVPLDVDETINVRTNPDTYASKLAICKQAIVAQFPINTNVDQVTGVELTCNDQPSWHTLMPVNVQIFTKVLVAKRTILAKEEITDDVIDYATYDKNTLFNSYFKDKNEILGQVASHVITPGMVLTKKNLQAPILIHKNEVVNLVAKSNTVSVSMQGIAKTEGCLHDSIKVYNPSSKRTVDAVVAGPNRAEIVA